ncbi:hypothetical protein [Bartonella sp. AP58NXGY]|uniref:hypothetical protein n=1 Tax=Bartonella sp. AP58NXGY TaxID=3243498 RepID=UPI0035D0679C
MAKKKHAKRRRPRIKGCVREPNGRISRAKIPREPIDKLAIEIRAKRFGLTIYVSFLMRFISILAVKKELTSDEKSLKCVHIYTL